MKEENSLNYPFLSDEIINFKLSRKEVDVLKIRHFHRNRYRSGGEYALGSDGEYNDFISVLASCGGAEALVANHMIEDSPINENVLFDIVSHNNIKKFDIQALNKADIKEIISEHISLDTLQSLMNNIQEKDCYVLKCTDGEYLYTGDLDKEIKYSTSPVYYESDRKYTAETAEYLTGRKASSFKGKSNYSGQEYSVNNPNDFIFISDYSSYITTVSVPTISSKLNTDYEKAVKAYEIDMKEYQNKKVLYEEKINAGLEAIEPIEPVKPEKSAAMMYKACLTYKGVELYKFLKSFEDEPVYKDSRLGLKDKSGQTTEAFGVLSEIQTDRRLFRNVVVDGITYDHMWIFNNISKVTDIGKIYRISGEVIEYKNKEGITKFAIKPSDITEFKEV